MQNNQTKPNELQPRSNTVDNPQLFDRLPIINFKWMLLDSGYLVVDSVSLGEKRFAFGFC